jgi:bacterioferritin (cytochrome b1)
MSKTTHMGMNRTGIDIAPILSKEMIRSSDDVPADLSGLSQLVAFRQQHILEADRLGSVPIPGTFKGAMVSLKDKLTGKNPEVLINKLGERLAYERNGVRLYEALITKCETLQNDQIGAIFSVEQLRQIRNDEADHFAMLTEVMESIGADPTAQTPDADVIGVLSMGIVKVITDPRTTVPQSLCAILTAELSDTAGWELLTTLAEDMGMTEMAERFRLATAEEERHIAQVRGWLTQLTLVDSGVMPTMRH